MPAPETGPGPIRLSVCIPTYNFGAFIRETLDSVIREAGPATEIVVVDGASTDNTGEVVREAQSRFPRLAYHLLPAKGGIDRDIEISVEKARGEWCWLLSSDDVLVPGALRRLEQALPSDTDIYLCNRIETDRNLVPVRADRWLAGRAGDRSFRFPGPEAWIEYCRLAKSIGALFSYMSSIIVRKAAWDRASHGAEYLGTNYAHVARLVSILQGGGRLTCLDEPRVLCRGENDSFRDRGVLRRYLIDFQGYDRLSRGLFADPAVRTAFRDVVRREHRWYLLTQVRHAAAVSGRPWRELDSLLRSYRYPAWERFLIDRLGSSRVVMGLAFPARRAYKRWRSRTARAQG